MRALVIICALLAGLPVWAEQVVADMSLRDVEITANFDGSDILIYGAIKGAREEENLAPLEVVIAISGPQGPITVRRKEKHFGIWVNTDAIKVDRAPSFYAVASSGALEDTLTYTEDLRYQVSIPRAIYAVGTPAEIEDPESFTEALIRIRKGQNLYQQLDNTVEVQQQSLFSTTIDLPANLVEGVYPTRIFITREGEVVGKLTTFIDVRKVGLERWIYDLAHDRPLIYGVLSLTIAIAAGWLASAFFRFLRF
ncbi:MAG: TIGR02186 family protein [Litoreibacter sp.]|nr:TIGR02186 family protein [Litoreibacter sp.]MCY4336305.1 TIGR02186 family protein [Litoreibacter sp.]